MSSIGDLTVSISADASDLTAGMTQAREQLNQTTAVIVKQQSGWATLGAAAITSSASLTNTAVNFVIETKKMSAEWTRFAITTTLAGAAVLGFAAPVTTAKIAIAGGTAALIYHNQWLLKVIGVAVPGWGQIAAAVSLGITAYKAATFVISDTAAAFQGSIDGSRDSIFEYNRLNGATGRLSASMSALGASIVAPFRDGTSAIYNYVASFSPLPALAGVAASAFDGMASAANYVSSGLKSVTATATTAAFILATGASYDATAAFTEQGISLEKLSAQTTAFIAKQEFARSSFQSLKSIQENAASTAKNAAEVSKVASILTVEGIDQSIASLREKSAATIMAGDADKAWEQQTASLFNALEKQRQGIIDGTVVDQAAIDAKKALAKATEDAAKAAAAAAEKEQQKTLSGIAKIEAMKDEIDKLNGSATNADIAMREMFRQGFSNDQIEEVGKLTEELDRLKEEEKEGKKKDKKGKAEDLKGPSAALQGSSAALSAIFAAGRNPTEERTAKAAETLVIETRRTNQKLDQVIAGENATSGGAIS